VSELEELEKRMRNLPPEELAKIRAWFIEFDHILWDKEIEAGVKAGKLDRLINEARADYEAGKARKL
jgi:hypothetical protein